MRIYNKLKHYQASMAATRAQKLFYGPGPVYLNFVDILLTKQNHQNCPKMGFYLALGRLSENCPLRDAIHYEGDLDTATLTTKRQILPQNGQFNDETPP